MWTKPEFTEMRFGFEVTMYIDNRCIALKVPKGCFRAAFFFASRWRRPKKRIWRGLEKISRCTSVFVPLVEQICDVPRRTLAHV